MKTLLFFLLLIVCVNAHAQNLPAFKALRYEEDYAWLKADSSKTLTRCIKYIPLSARNAASYLSFGGDIRYQYFTIKNENWGDAPKDNDGYLFSRLLLHADLHAGKHFRGFLQLQSSMANGRAFTSPLDEDPLELHQAFVDAYFKAAANTHITIRAGRQEFAYGSQRLIAVRDGPNNRQSFEGLKVIAAGKHFRADLFATYFIRAKKGLFNDGHNTDTKFWGAYLTKDKLPLLQHVDLYYLGLWKKTAAFDDGIAKELRHNIGSRIFGNKKAFRYDIEGLYQFGKFGAKTIDAWTASANLAYKLQRIKFKPELGLKTEVISGDATPGDDKLQSFNPLFPRGGYFGLASLIGPANLYDIHPSLQFELRKNIFLDMDYDLFWRYSLHDGIYTPGVGLIYSGKNNPYRYIGDQLSGDLVFTPDNMLYFRGEFTWFRTGDFLKAAGAGKNILFTCITAQLKF